MAKKSKLYIILILFIAAFLRFYNLMHDSPHFFNPDERNMASSITRFSLPSKLLKIPFCLLKEFSTDNRKLTTDNCNLNPRFFAYGQFPLYLSYLSDQITKPLINLFLKTPTTDHRLLTTDFPSAIFYLRFWSFFSSTLTVFLAFLISRQLLTFNFALLTAALVAFTPGLIQSAHFGTTESLLTFFFLASVYLSFKLSSLLNHLSDLKHPSSIFHLLSSIFLLSLTVGLALGSKFTGIFFFVPPLISLMIQTTKLFKLKKRKRRRKIIIGLLGYWVIGLLVFIGSIIFAVISSPYNLIEKQNFMSAVFGYEADVATGKYEAFYTRQFVNTKPVLFQAEKVFPYVLGWPVFILGTLGFLLMNLNILLKLSQIIIRRIGNYKLRIKDKSLLNIHDSCFLILTFSFLIYFLPNAFLFAKWTRFMVPVFPFFSIFTGYLFSKLYLLIMTSSFNFQFSPPSGGFNFQSIFKYQFLNLKLAYWIIGLLVLIGSITPGMAFMSIYTREDSRVTASKWIYENIPNNSYILFETANVVDIPLGIPDYKPPTPDYNLTTISFDFYHLEENPVLFDQLLGHLEKADYFFIPSRRIFFNYPRFPEKFPLITKYYQLLFSGRLGFEKVTEISSYPSLTIPLYPLPAQAGKPYTLIAFPDEQSEETFTVFDHPVIRIYKKVNPLTKTQYKNLFETK